MIPVTLRTPFRFHEFMGSTSVHMRIRVFLHMGHIYYLCARVCEADRHDFDQPPVIYFWLATLLHGY